MIIHQMSREECLTVLARTRLGRLACTLEGQPYVVPIYFVLDQPFADEINLYSFSATGQKIEWMRDNPLVCVEVDEVRSCDQWTSILLFGHYEELTDHPDTGPALWGSTRPPSEMEYERHRAWQLLKGQPLWWQPGSCGCEENRTPCTFRPVFYRIRVDQITGRRAMPSPAEAMRSTTFLPDSEEHCWLRRVFDAFRHRSLARQECKGVE